MEMHDKSRPNGLHKHYKVMEIRDGQITERVLTRQERDALDPDDIDVQIDEPQQVIFIKHKDNLEPTRYGPGEMPGIGTSEWKLLAEAVCSAGDIFELRRKDSCIHQRVRRLRRLFGDNKWDEWFLITVAAPSYGLAINLARTWRFIELLAE